MSKKAKTTAKATDDYEDEQLSIEEYPGEADPVGPSTYATATGDLVETNRMWSMEMAIEHAKTQGQGFNHTHLTELAEAILKFIETPTATP